MKLLGLTTSPFDAEALAAICKANDLIRAAGATWADVISTASAEPKPKPGEWREPENWQDAVLICLTLAPSPMSKWDFQFLHGIAGRSSLTGKQQRQLDRIVSACRLRAAMAA